MAGPGSHQLTNTRMPNHDTSVVIQQAMPSPQSSSVITQAPSTNRQIGWVHFCFLVSPVLWLQQLHGGPSVAFVVLKVQLHAGPDVVFMVLEVTGFALGPASMRQGPLQHVLHTVGEWRGYCIYSRPGTLVERGSVLYLQGSPAFSTHFFVFICLHYMKKTHFICLHVVSLTALGRKSISEADPFASFNGNSGCSVGLGCFLHTPFNWGC